MGHGHFGRHFVGSHFSLVYIYIMSDLFDAGSRGDLERVQALVEQGADKEKTGGLYGGLISASYYGHLEVVRYLLGVKQVMSETRVE